MKKKTLIVAIVLSFVLVCSSLLTGCASENILGAKETSWIDVYNNEPPADITYSSITELSLEGDILDYEGNFFLTAKAIDGAVKYTVYDIRTLNAVYTYTDETEGSIDLEDIFFYEDAEFFILQEEIEGEAKSSIVYNGTKVVTEDGLHEALFNEELFYNYGFFNFAGDLYRQTESGVSLVKAKEDGMTTLPNTASVYCGEKYFWVKVNYSSSYTAFDLTLKPVTEYIIPSYARDASIFELAKDRIIVQYLIPVDANSDDYTLIIGSEKYNVYQSIYNTESKSETVVDLKGLVDYTYVVNQEEDAEYYKKNRLSTIASILPIENKHLNYQIGGTYNVNENGGIVEKLVAPGGFEYIYVYGAVAKDRYLSENEYVGAYQVLNQKGEAIVSFTGDVYNRNFFIKDKAIYNYNGEKVDEFGEDDEVILFENVVIIAESKGDNKYDVYVLAPGAAKQKVGTVGDVESDQKWSYDYYAGENRWYVVETKVDGVVKQVYYNEYGTKLIEVDEALEEIISYDEGKVVIFSAEVEGVTKYYAMK